MADAENQVIVGLEVHCQLDTKSKLFCGCSTDYRSDGPNTHVCPVCLGLPGTMPSLNRRAIEYAMKVAKALNCGILDESEFSRKNYFYPDLDKAYQITQYDKPLAEGGTWRSRAMKAGSGRSGSPGSMSRKTRAGSSTWAMPSGANTRLSTTTVPASRSSRSSRNPTCGRLRKPGSS